jgi:cobalt-zinc-cadmium efflux system outer membrane protein
MRVYCLLAGLLVACAPARAAALGLDQCLALARQHAPALQAAAADVTRAEHAIRAAQAALRPKLNFDASFAQVNEAPKAVFDTPGLPALQSRPVIKLGSASALNVKTELDYTIYSGGRDPALVRAAQADARGENSGRDEADADLVLRVSQAYFREVSAGHLQSAAEEALAVARSHLDVAQARVQAGVVPKLDALRADENASQREIARVRAREARRMARVALETAIGTELPPGEALDEPASPSPVAPDSSAALAAARAARPEIAALQRQIEAKTERIVAERAKRRPRIGFTGSAEYIGPNKVEDYANFTDPGLKTYAFRARVGMTVPILDGGEIGAHVDELSAERAVLEARLNDLDLGVRREVEQARSDLRVAVAVWDANESRITSAREALRLASASYKEGTATGTDVRDAETALADARAEEAESLRDYWFARVELDRATAATLPAKDYPGKEN